MKVDQSDLMLFSIDDSDKLSYVYIFGPSKFYIHSYNPYTSLQSLYAYIQVSTNTNRDRDKEGESSVEFIL